MVTEGEETGCKGEVAALTGQDSVAVIFSLFCSGDSLQLSSVSLHRICKRILSDRRQLRLLCLEGCLRARYP